MNLVRKKPNEEARDKGCFEACSRCHDRMRMSLTTKFAVLIAWLRVVREFLSWRFRSLDAFLTL